VADIERLGDGGELYATDLSSGMLKVARRGLSGYRRAHELVMCDGSYLPLADSEFDAAHYFGGSRRPASAEGLCSRRRASSGLATVWSSETKVLLHGSDTRGSARSS
jgi:hypothetical protein